MQSESARRRLVEHIHELERIDEQKRYAQEAFAGALAVAKAEGYDTTTLRVVLKLRKMTPGQRLERRALEAIYMAALGLLDGEAMPDEARRRLSGEAPTNPAEPRLRDLDPPPPPAADAPPPPAQAPLVLKEPAEAKQEGADAAAAGKRIYDNPYAAGDPCRAAWDEGWCGQRNSNGMDVPQAYQRRQPPKKDKDEDKDRDQGGDADGKAA